MTADPRADVGAALGEIVGGAHVLAGETAAAFAIDSRAPRWVAAPGSVEEVGRCLALASARGLAVAPTGRGTRRHWGNAPRALDLVLSLRRLDRILAHEPADLTMSVEAGATLGQVNTHLRPYRQLLPLDPPRADGSTVGGIIATAASGPYRARYGTIRDLLLGVTVVRADGTVVKGGGRVVKNVTGYDMPKLHVGALGTLGVVVAAHLRLHPMPETETTWLFGFSSTEAGLEAGLGIMDAPVVVSRLEFLDRATLAALDHVPPPPAALALTLGGVAEGVRAQGERIAEICARGDGVPIPVSGAGAWWRRLSESWWLGETDALALRIGSRPADLVKAWRTVEAAAAGAWTWRAAGEVVNGVLHVTLQSAPPDDAVSLIRRVREGLAPLDATCVVEYAPPALKPTLDVWGDVGPALDIMHRLKAEMDAQGVLNPGRYVGGI
ncbi:MAG: FAD-binding oxidoreductase [Candidatus Rokubacteria bacterium]|nr:FAD-binding oxidoreductase [Candidatus Rokubacteria bacterium]